MFWLAILTVIFIVVLFLYWQLIIAEGAYLGVFVVAFLYNRIAKSYNKIKQFDTVWEDSSLGKPLSNRLHNQPTAITLDVATGTGRIPCLLLRQPSYQGHIIGLDRASKMLDVAQRETAIYKNRVTLIQADATSLPFASNSLPLIICLESLEFLPNPKKGLAEIVRVSKPSSEANPDCGWLVVTNRIGWEARLMPGKTWRREQLVDILAKFPLRYVDIQLWQTIYDLVLAQKVEDRR